MMRKLNHNFKRTLNMFYYCRPKLYIFVRQILGTNVLNSLVRTLNSLVFQPAFTRTKLTTETLKQGVKHV